MTASPSPRHLVLYDGVCGLCDRAVQWLLRHDRRQRLVFAPLQGETARAIFARHPGLETIASPTDGRGSLVLARSNGDGTEDVFTRSRGAIEIAIAVQGIWRCAALLRAIPRPLRDLVYDFIARHRYRWFGRFDTCQLPAPEWTNRFLP